MLWRAKNYSHLFEVDGRKVRLRVEGEAELVSEGYWWVNQGGQYEVESKGGHIFAPSQSESGRVPQHWANLTSVNPGDVIFHYARGAIRSVSRVLQGARESTRPLGDGSETSFQVAGFDLPGNLVETEYFELSQPIGLEEIPSDWRVPELGPFTAGRKRSGTVHQGYLFPLSGDFAEKLRERFTDRWPPGSPIS